MQKENSVWGEVAKFSVCTGMVFLGLVESTTSHLGSQGREEEKRKKRKNNRQGLVRSGQSVDF